MRENRLVSDYFCLRILNGYHNTISYEKNQSFVET